MTTTIVSPLLGGSLLALLLVDVLLTVFHPQGHGGPLHRWQNRLLWAVLKRFGRSKGQDRPRFMALCGPVIAVSSVASWGLWLIVGYGLIYYPFRGAFRSAVGDGVPFVDALYYSGYVASTLGLGDVIPAAPVLRLLTVLEAMSGFALFAVATTYLLAVYQQVAHENVLALELSSLAADEPKTTVWAKWHENDAPGFRVWCDNTARSLLQVVHAHGQYPVLHYFRPADPDRALLVQIRRVLDLVQEPSVPFDNSLPQSWSFSRLTSLRLLERTLLFLRRQALSGTRNPQDIWKELIKRDTSRGSDSKEAPSRLLKVALKRYLVELNHGCLPAFREALPQGSSDEELTELYGRLAHYMCYPTGSQE